jgi:hypothetical protein
MPEPTYASLEEMLLSLGFALRGVVKHNKVFVHGPTGALIAYAVLPPEDKVLSRHLSQVRTVLTAYDILDSRELDARLLKAG